MVLPGGKKSSLGKSLIRDRFKGKGVYAQKDDDMIFPKRDKKNPDSNVGSITEQKDLDEFLATAELAGSQFISEKSNASVVTHYGAISGSQVMTLQSAKADVELKSEFKEMLRIPRRPPWNEATQAKELHRLERESFLNWRRSIALFQESHNMSMTPYEKNLEMWRQLWRVLEKSHLVVQIVDARNPLLFYCEDLVCYARELAQDKRNLLLINKADFLTDEQRTEWTKHLDAVGIDHIYYSADLAMKEGCSDTGAAQTGPKWTEMETDKNQGPCKITSRDELLDIFETYHKGLFSKEQVFVIGLVGYPNVGKSSTINSLLASKKVAVAPTPGKTKHFQTLFLNDATCLCDCPGLVFPNFATGKADLIVNGILPIDQMREYIEPCTLVAERIPRPVLERLYGIRLPLPGEGEAVHRAPSASELLSTYATARGYRTTNQGNPDESRGSRYILKDYVQGKLLFCFPPPSYKRSPREFNAKNAYTHSRLAHVALAEPSSAAPVQNRLTKLDEEFFNQGSARAKTTGKFATEQFARANLMNALSGVKGSSKRHFNKNKRKN